MKTQQYTNDWSWRGDFNTVGIDVVNELLHIVNSKIPEYFEYFPFRRAYIFESYKEEDFVCFVIKNSIGQLPTFQIIKDQIFINSCKSIHQSSQYPSFEQCYSALGNIGYEYGLFTYIGRVEGRKLSWPHIYDVLLDWLKQIVLPEVIGLNIKRVTDAIPTPPSYNISKLLENIYVIESAEGIKQGTAFHLKDYGLITCDHCIRNEDKDTILTDLVLYKGAEHSKKYSVIVERTNKELDIAIIKIESDILNKGLDIGNSDHLKHLDHIAVAGFPNYNYGDIGIFSPGMVVGFRTYSGLRHILINSPLIEGNSGGNSGGPAFDKDSKVIGIAVTGADKMSNAHKTEKHGLIPIEAIRYLQY